MKVLDKFGFWFLVVGYVGLLGMILYPWNSRKYLVFCAGHCVWNVVVFFSEGVEG